MNINMFLQQIDNVSFNIIMKCDNSSINIIDLQFEYTDEYHKDVQYLEHISLLINIYNSEPPYFVQPLDNLSINKCAQNDFMYKFPDVIDPDGEKVQIILNSETPQWIQLQSNEYLIIKRYKNEYLKLFNNFTIKLALIDISYTKVDFSIFVEVESCSNTMFNFIDDIKVAISTPKFISLDIDLIDIFAVK